MKKEYINPTIKVVAIHTGAVMQTSGFPDNLYLIWGEPVPGGIAD